MKKIAIIAIALILSLCLISCSAKQEDAFEAPTPIPTETATKTTEPTPEPTPTVDPSLSLTTGLHTDKEYAPIACMIENSTKARPQTGIQEADIVYEVMAEGGITRFLCIFNDQYPIVAGPIRSTRIYYINIQREWDVPLMHYGGPSTKGKDSCVYGSKFDDIKVRVDGLKSAKYTKYFWRSSERSAPNNVYSNIQRVKDECYEYPAGEREGFLFDANVDYQDGTAFTNVGIPFLSGNENHTSFAYDESTGLLMRSLSGKPFEIRTVTEDENGKQTTDTAQYSCTNLIVQYVKTYTFKNDIKGRRNVEVIGSGDCEYFIGGKYVKGHWERKSVDESTHYTLEDGSPVVLRPGKTWIAMQPNSDTVTVS